MRERGGPGRGSTSPFVAALLVCLVGSAAGAGLSCREKGFGDSLQCSSCKQLKAAVGDDDELVGECEGCCSDDSAREGAKTFNEAKLEICN